MSTNTSTPHAPGTPAEAGAGPGPGGRVAQLRAAQAAEVDPRRLRAAALAVCVAGLVAAAVLLFVSGAHRNAQVAALHDRGVPVVVTSTGCTGLLGGSGSNPVGYACRGTYTSGGHRYAAALPGSTLRPPGTTATLVVDPQDPGLLTTPAAARTERPTARVFVLPSVLAVAAVALVAAAGLVRRRRIRRGDPALPAGPDQPALRFLGAPGGV